MGPCSSPARSIYSKGSQPEVMNSLSVAIFHRPIPSSRLGSGATRTATSKDDLQATDHPRKREAPYSDVIQANRRIMCGQRGLSGERAEPPMTEQQQADRHAQNPVHHPRTVDGEWSHGGRPHRCEPAAQAARDTVKGQEGQWYPIVASPFDKLPHGITRERSQCRRPERPRQSGAATRSAAARQPSSVPD